MFPPVRLAEEVIIHDGSVAVLLECLRTPPITGLFRLQRTCYEDVQAVGITFVSLGEGIDCTTVAGRQQLHVLAVLAEFERARIAERVRTGLARVALLGSDRVVLPPA
jgi:Resolvase, N terminal domain